MKQINKNYVGFANTFDKEYLTLFNENAREKFTDTFSFVIKDRNPFCNANYSDKYTIITYKIELLKDKSVYSIVSQQQGDLHLTGTYLYDAQKYFSLNIRAKRVLSDSNSNVFLITKNFETKEILKNDSTAYYYLPSGEFSIKYNLSGLVDFFIKTDESFFAKDKIPKSVLFMKRDNNLYFLMMFPIHEGDELPKKLLYSLIS